MATPIFATIYDTEKPIRVTVDRALAGDEKLRLYIFDSSETRIAQNNNDYIWAEQSRGGTAPNFTPAIAANETVELYIDCDQLYTNTGLLGTYFINAVIWDADNDLEESVGSQVLVLQNLLYPEQ